MIKFYILDSQTPLRIADPLKETEWFEHVNRQVAVDQVGDTKISTVFLGSCVSSEQSGPPMLFETRCLGGVLSDKLRHYATWDEALEGHRLIVEQARAGT